MLGASLSSADYVRIHAFTAEEDAYIKQRATEGASYAAIGLELRVQPSLIFIHGLSLGAFKGLALHECPALNHEGYFQLPPIPDVHAHQIYVDRVASKSAWVMEHQWITAYYHRQLNKGEQAHHINFWPVDNTPENLWPCSGAAHLHAQNSLQHIVRDLIESRAMKFDRDTGLYLVAGELAQVIYRK